MASSSAQHTGGMAEESKQESDIHAPHAGPPVPECNLNRPIVDDRQEASAVEKTCWKRFSESRVVVFCSGLPESRVAMLLYCLLALSPVVDILSDVLTAVNFALRGHPWWATLTLVVFYMSGRFTVVFMALSPVPSARNLVCLYVPGCWIWVGKNETPSARVEEATPFGVRGGASGTGASSPLGNPLGALPGEPSPEDVDLEDPRDPAAGTQSPPQPQPGKAPRPTTQANPQLVKMTRNFFTTYVYNVLKVHAADLSACCPCATWVVPVVIEIVLIPFACFAIVPIGISAVSLAGNYLKAGLGSADGSDTTADDAVRKQANLFLQMVSIVEALLESAPQLALQVRAGVHGGELTEWVFVFSVSASAFCIAKAIVGFAFNHRKIRDTFLGLQGRVVGFMTLHARAPHPGEPWRVATVAEVNDNPALLRRGGLGEWYIANLQDGMQVNGPERDYRVEPNNAVLGHTLYSRK